ncbi:hypothetical protein [Roseomonas sp. BN140053]|uniref:hypothetical protein n=1 Tax=Roseomonas sp. BN140053 TaxID=3391898 RepID=UPI0039ECADAA
MELGYTRGRYYPRMYDADRILADPEGFAEAAQRVYRRVGLNAADARAAAEDWIDRLSGVGRGAADYAHTPTGNFTKGRALPADTDTLMRDWLVTDPRQALSHYFERTSRLAEFTRRFGKSGEKAEEMFTAMRRGGVPPADIALMRGWFAASTGTLRTASSGPAVAMGNWVQTLGTLAVLPRAVLSGLVEAGTVGSRTGNPLTGLKAVHESYKALLNTADTRQARQAAEMMGIISDGLTDATIAARMDTQSAPAMQRNLTSQMFRQTGMYAITSAQQVAATKIGQVWVRQLAADVAEGASTRASSARLLAELGLDENQARAMHAGLGRNDGVPTLPDLLGNAPEAQVYRGAIRRFVRESIQEPQAVDKPALAGSPVGRLAYGITSFMFAFTRNVLLRSIKQAGEGVSGEGYTMADRARLIGPLVGYMSLGAMQYGVSELRERLFNPQAQDERDPWVRTILNLDRAGAFGNLSPFINMVSSAKYDRDPSSLMTGPYLAHFATNLGKMTLGLVPQPVGPNSPNTNNAEHSAVRALHAAVLAPAVAATLSSLPGGPALQAAYGSGTMAATSRGAGRALADTAVGEPTTKPRTAGGAARGGISASAGIRSSGGISGGRSISSSSGISAR